MSIALILSAIGTFVVTNIDDIFVLMIFFAQIEKARHANIVLGQYLGFGLLVLISILGAFGFTFLPPEWTGFLGLIPIILGIRMFLKKEEEDEAEEALEKLGDVKTQASNNRLFGPLTGKVAAITFANGGDNLGIYIPYFTTQGTGSLIYIAVIFLVMVAVWCFFGYRLARFPAILKVLQKYGSVIVPLVFIALGISIMVHGDSFEYLIGLFR
ncbi:cadmium resistance protein CadD [Paenibacillus antri]|uniref:Cadmium resistance protein CadD n=1 Tax=Paenibacillus antri TaxID=2582848 RepID=A0A5R9G7W0_9BACL|nr:cadmium resistance transporter [Paenibacillus antri]TLS52507.1 cadmium resistance protein CadD [Paenibacillus antri]